MGENNDNNNIQANTNSIGTVADQSTIANKASQDHNRQPGNTIGNNTSQDHKNNTANTEETTTTLSKPKVGYVVVPYTKGLSESFKNICGKYGIQTYFKGNTTIKQTLMRPKDQDLKDSRSGLIYWYKCDDITCSEEYIGETDRTLGERYKEHLKETSHIHVHILQTGHNTTTNNFSILGREDRNQARTIKEAIYIRVNNPLLNRNVGVGKYNLSYLWDRVLFNTPGLKIGSSQYPSHLHNNSIAQPITANR